MKLSCDWSAKFDNKRQRVNLKKQLYSPRSGPYFRKETLELRVQGDDRKLARIDPVSGFPITGNHASVPPITMKEIMVEVDRRWPVGDKS